MDELYERAAILEYVTNLASSVGRSSPVACEFIEWLEQNGWKLGVEINTDDAFNESTRKYRVRKSRKSVSKKLWAEIQDVLAALLKQRRRSKPSVFQKNLTTMADRLKLDPLETQIFVLAYRYKSNEIFENLCDNLLGEGIVDSTTLVSMLLKVPKNSLFLKLNTTGPLIGAGLILKDSCKPYAYSRTFFDLPETLLTAISPPNNGFKEIFKSLVNKPLISTLDWADFSHISEERNFAADILKGALKERAKGINILLYGPPGTGKTEFCKTLADHLKMSLYGIGESQADGGEPSREDRLAHALLGQQLLKNENECLLLFDEMDDLISGGSFQIFGMRINSEKGDGSKAFINRFLENNPVPTLWTCNDIENFDPAHLRRMTLAIELRTPPASVRERVWRRCLDREKITLPDHDIKTLARELKAPPALAGNAIRASRLAGGDTARIELAVRNVSKALRGGIDLPPKQNSDAPYDDQLVNADMNLADLVARLSRPTAVKNFSLCLYGLPGTGKSAFARHLAEAMGFEVLQKRASDLVSMWVGMTEQQIAGAFREAREERAFLIIDEADSMLQERQGATHSWEISRVNEMLTWMESHPLPFACTTNLMESIDRASLRRFTFKVQFDCLTKFQVEGAFEHFFRNSPPKGIDRLTNLTPGDFAVVARKAKITGDINEPAVLLEMLQAECTAKLNASKPIGFNAT
jgi:transitional endoplasmic reticulum ATPase